MLLWIVILGLVGAGSVPLVLAYLYGYLPGTYRYSLRALGHKSRKVVIAAAQHLGKVKNPESVGPLIRCLKKPDPGIRKACIESLSAIGRPAIEPLCQTFIHHDEELRFSAVQALLGIDRSASIDPLCRKLATSPAFIRRYVSEALVQIGVEVIEPLLLNAPQMAVGTYDDKREESQSVFENFTDVLTRIGKKDPDILYQAIAAGDNQKLLLAQALGRLNDDRAPSLLCRILGSKNPNLRHLALEGLKDLGEGAVPAIVDVLRGKNEIAKKGAVDLLVAIGGRAHRALFELIEVDDPQVRVDAAVALARMGRVRPLITVLWPKKHVEIAYIIENGAKTKIDTLGNIAVFRMAIEQALYFGKMSKKYRAMYYLQSLLILVFPEAVSRIDDPRLGTVLGFGGGVVENFGFLRVTHIHPIARKELERPKKTGKKKKGKRGQDVEEEQAFTPEEFPDAASLAEGYA